MSLYVDPAELDRAAGIYTGAATDTAALVDTCPTSVDAGLATGPLTGMIARSSPTSPAWSRCSAERVAC